MSDSKHGGKGSGDQFIQLVAIVGGLLILAAMVKLGPQTR
jgi:hypothetical protein